MDLPLTQDMKIVQAVLYASGVAAATNITGETVDTDGFEKVTFIVQFGAIVTGAVTSIKVQRGNASNLSDAADIEGSAQTVADNADGKVFYVDILRPRERYVRLIVSRATQNAALSAICILHGARNKPPTQPADVSGEVIKDANEGTA